MHYLVFLFFLISCQNVLRADDTEDVILSSNNIANDVYQVLAKEEGNVLYCPVSLNILLALTTLAARGNTATELKKALHLNTGNDNIKSGYKGLLKDVQGEIFKLATRIYPKQGLDLKSEFQTTGSTYFNSDVEKVNFRDGSNAAKIINTFVEKNTGNKIHDLVSADSFNENTMLVLVNAAYFKGHWDNSFSPPFLGDFYLAKNHKVNTKMVFREGVYNYKEIKSLGARVVQIPYKIKGYNMLIILPNTIDGLLEVENKLKLLNFDDIYNNLTSRPVELTLPVFKIEKRMKLTKVLQQLGIKTVFSHKADLSGMANVDELSVSDVLQKTYIKVDSEGTEAAAATGVFTSVKSSVTYSNTINFKADHPFIFVLMKGKLILFIGRLSQV